MSLEVVGQLKASSTGHDVDMERRKSLAKSQDLYAPRLVDLQIKCRSANPTLP